MGNLFFMLGELMIKRAPHGMLLLGRKPPFGLIKSPLLYGGHTVGVGV